MPKPVVHYHPTGGDVIQVERPAYLVRVIDHPGPYVSNTKPIITSRVIWYDEVSGAFETMNTKYERLVI